MTDTAPVTTRREQMRHLIEHRNLLANQIATAVLHSADPVMYAGLLVEYRQVTETFDALVGTSLD